MELTTKALERLFEKHPLYSGEEKYDDQGNRPILAKYFTPDSNWTWYVLEAERQGDDWYFYGYVEGFESEYGPFLLSDLQSARGPLGLAIERDLYFRNKRLRDVDKRLESASIATPSQKAAPAMLIRRRRRRSRRRRLAPLGLRTR